MQRLPAQVLLTSQTLFHSRKLPVRDYLAVIALFVNGVKGTSALQISRDLNIQPFPFGEHRRPGYSVVWTCGGARRAARSSVMICCRHSMPSLVKAVTPSSPMP